MKHTKPMKVPVLCRPFRGPLGNEFHIAAILAFPMSSPRALLDEVAFWPAVTAALGTMSFDEGVSKARGELLVAGRCVAPGGVPVEATHVRVRVGRVDQRLSVLGDRYWRNGIPTPPEPFKEIPIDWGHAFGGPGHIENPYGKGIVEVDRLGTRCVPLPNVEPFGSLLRSPNDRPTPASLSPMDVTFAQRRALAGTFDSTYVERYAPGLPPDHDPDFFNLAPPALRIDGYWSGDETFLVENMNAAQARQEGRLPGLVARAFVAQLKPGDENLREVPLRCDTVWLFPTIDLGAVVFRGRIPIIEDDASDIAHLLVACEESNKPRALEHYERARARRLDKERGAIADLSDSDLMPDRESGVTPNVSFGELGQWTRSEGIAAARAERGRQRRIARSREEVVAAGGDPSMLDALSAPMTSSAPPTDDLDALASYIEGQFAPIEAQRAEAHSVEERVAEAARVAATALGDDSIENVVNDKETAGGPPKFRAADVRKMMSDLAATARAEGTPALALEAQLADPQFLRQLEENERALLDTYRRGAHLTPHAPPMTEEAVQIARLVVQAARESNEVLDGRDFTGADLRGLDLRNMSFRMALLEGADLRGADLSEARFDGAVLARADLRGANLTRAQLAGANVGGANLKGATLEDANLRDAVLTRARLENACLVRATLVGSELIEVEWGGVDLSGACLDGCNLVKANLVEAKLDGASLIRATFVQCCFDDASFRGARLDKASFISCAGARVVFFEACAPESVFVNGSAFPDSDFTAATLERCCMRTTQLQRARFDRAQMTMADLSECDATMAQFDRAVLRSALLVRTRLDSASLRGANFTDALLTKSTIPSVDFTGAQLTRADLSGAVGDDHTSFREATVAWLKLDKVANHRRGS